MARPNFTTQIAGTYDYSNRSGTKFTQTGQLSRRATEVVSGTNRRKPSGYLAPTAYSLEREVMRYPTGFALKTSLVGGYWEQYYGSLGPGYVPIDVLNNGGYSTMSQLAVSQKYRDQALVKARLKMKQSKVNLGVAFAERKRTAMLVGDTATRIGKSMFALLRRDWRTAWQQLGLSSRHKPRGSSFHDKWLEMQYGWKPLLSDVYGACEALTMLRGDDWLVTARAHAGQKRKLKFDGFLYGSAGQTYGRMEGEVEEGCFVRIDATVSSPLHDIASLGVSNPLLIAWELVPYSFVLDWMLPVGNWLDSFDALFGYDVRGCSISQFVRVNRSFHGTQKVHDGYVFRNEWSATRQQIKLLRTTSTDVPLPSLPRFKDPRSSQHMANGLALLASAIARVASARR